MSNLIKLVSNIVKNDQTKIELAKKGLCAIHVAWEDVARSKFSVYGPNITDVTLVTKGSYIYMPMIRSNNYVDNTEDVPIDTFNIRVDGKMVSFKEYLEKTLKLYHPRDEIILFKSQCCVLPTDRGSVEFAPKVFNYQSKPDDPKVLVVTVSNLGTSAQIVTGDDKIIYFNDNQVAKWFSIKRLEDIRKERIQSFKQMSKEEKQDNVLMIFQIPVVRKVPFVYKPNGNFTRRCYVGGLESASYTNEQNECSEECNEECNNRSEILYDDNSKRGMDFGQISIGSEYGPFKGTKDSNDEEIELIRDSQYPIRCTFQYYRVTDQNFITKEDIADIAEQLLQSSKIAVASGSLVVDPSTDRATKIIENIEDPEIKRKCSDVNEPAMAGFI